MGALHVIMRSGGRAMDLLAIDVGTGTADILVYKEGEKIENCVKLILPSQTRVIAQKIRKARELGEDVFLFGTVMGGGPLSQAVKEHIRSGLKVYATEDAAKSIRDDLEIVKKMGVIITEDANALAFKTGDIPLELIKTILRESEVEIPDNIAIAVQDHGFSTNMSNRVFRFKWMKELLEKERDLFNLSFESPPEYLTRMRAVIKSVESEFENVMVMDTGFAALAGASGRTSERLLIINAGNGHTLAGIVESGRLIGIFEHHTRMLDEKYPKMLEKFVRGDLTFEEVFRSGGHGALIIERPKNVERILAIGPKRELLRRMKIDAEFPAPYGDMMLVGCFGLVRSFFWKKRGEIPI